MVRMKYLAHWVFLSIRKQESMALSGINHKLILAKKKIFCQPGWIFLYYTVFNFSDYNWNIHDVNFINRMVKISVTQISNIQQMQDK